MARVLRRDYSKLTRNLSGYRRGSGSFCSNDPLGKSPMAKQTRVLSGVEQQRARSRVEPRTARPLCKLGIHGPRTFGLSFFRRGARPNAGGSWRHRDAVGAGLVVLLGVLWTAQVHAGAAEDKLLAQRIIAESWPAAASACRLGLTLQPQPEWDTPLDGALRERCLNGAKFYIKLTSPAHSVWKGGPTVFRCDGAYMRDAMKCRGW